MHDGKKRKEAEPFGTASLYRSSAHSGWGGIQIGFENSFPNNGLGQSTKSSVTKSVTVCDEPIIQTKEQRRIIMTIVSHRSRKTNSRIR